MKKQKLTIVLASVLVISVLVNIMLIGWILSVTPKTYEQTYTWEQINNDDSISSGYVFYLYLGFDKQKREFLDDNEFLIGDKIDYCNIEMLVKKPEDLTIEPEKIEIVSPSGLTYQENFRQTTNENYFTAGYLSKYGERAIINFDESGLWSLRIEFEHEGRPIGFRYCGIYSKNFDYNSKITVFNSDINVNVYTTSEYAQLRSARASEASAFWSTISTFALIAAAVIAVFTLAYYLWSFNKQREISYAQQNRIEIYEPLYDEITKINDNLEKFGCSFNAKSTLKVFDNLKASQKIRIPKSLEDKIKYFDKLSRKYYNLHYKARIILKEEIDSVVDRYSIEGVNRGETTEESRQILESVRRIKQQVVEQYHGDFFAGKTFDKREKSSLRELRSYLKYNDRYTEDHIFNRIFSQIANNQTILELRYIHTELIYFSKELENYLSQKISDILNIYESKLEDI